jgi:hypothetical protein
MYFVSFSGAKKKRMFARDLKVKLGGRGEGSEYFKYLIGVFK